MTSSRPYIARALYDWILDNDCTPYILVDANREGVAVPGEYVQDGQIVLNISPVAVRALDIGNDALTFDGRFGGEALTIYVPVEALMAIYARENGQGMVFEVETAAVHGEGEVIEEPEAPTPPKPPRPPKPGRPSLKVVK
ncbi:ClpXP protease specificity-enhancing factor [Endozoicomonas sp. Mp262]